MMNRIAGRFFVISMLLAAATAMAAAQVPPGTINGIVSDPHEAVVPNAHVVAINKAQGVSRESSSNADGLYVFANLPAGNYELKIEAAGFAPTEYKEVMVRAGRTTTIFGRTPPPDTIRPVADALELFVLSNLHFRFGSTGRHTCSSS
jgi:hypothetical protein